VRADIGIESPGRPTSVIATSRIGMPDGRYHTFLVPLQSGRLGITFVLPKSGHSAPVGGTREWHLTE
jgi:hypothetical protein